MTGRCRTFARCVIILAALGMSIMFSCRTDVQSTGLRVVSLSPAMTEIIFALGEQEHLVGITTFCTYPTEALAIEKVGDFSNPSIERIVALKPDFVIVNTPEQRRIMQQLLHMGIDVLESSPTALADVYREIMEVGRRLNAVSAAESIVGYMRSNISPRGGVVKSVYVELSPRPLITIGSDTFLNEMLALAGGANVFSDCDKAYPVVTAEAVIQRDPEIIIVLHPVPFGDRIGWRNVRAVSTGLVFTDLDQDHLMRPGPRLVLGFRELCNVLSD